jgi:hypothetical protein
MKPQPKDFAAVESPWRGPELLRKLMSVALARGNVRRYLSLRRAWVRAQAQILRVS